MAKSAGPARPYCRRLLSMFHAHYTPLLLIIMESFFPDGVYSRVRSVCYGAATLDYLARTSRHAVMEVATKEPP